MTLHNNLQQKKIIKCKVILFIIIYWQLNEQNTSRNLTYKLEFIFKTQK